MRRRRWWLAATLAGLVVVAALVAFILFRRSRAPARPELIAAGDFTYARALAEYEVEKVMAQRHIPGMAALLIDDQDVVWQGYFGYADRENEIAVSNQTVFKLWSLAKPLTALEALRLVEEGLLDLDAPLDVYLPGFTIQSRFTENPPITARQLLAHHAGLPRNGCSFQLPWQTGADARAAVVAALSGCYLAYPTGTRYKYSNVGYAALGYIIQDLRGQAFPLYMRDRLLQPIGMVDSAFYSTELPSGSVQAVGYEYFEREYYRYEQEDIGSIPSGNLSATPDDLALLVRFLFREGEVGGDQFISPDTLAAMMVDQYSRPADPQPMGLGWKLGTLPNSDRLVWHDGGPTEGIGSLIAMLPDRKLGVVLLGNSVAFEGSVALPIAMDLLEIMVETRDGDVAPADEAPDVVAINAAGVERLAGSYALFGQTMTIAAEGNKIAGRIQGMRFDLVPRAENRFGLSHWLLKLGLDDFLALPLDLRDVEMAFVAGAAPAEDALIVDFGGVNYEICPRYPALEAGSLWERLAGTYELYVQPPAGQPLGDPIGVSEILLTEGRLTMRGVVGPLQPLDDQTLVILSGSFQGETIAVDPQTGRLTHQGLLFVPAAVNE